MRAANPGPCRSNSPNAFGGNLEGDLLHWASLKSSGSSAFLMEEILAPISSAVVFIRALRFKPAQQRDSNRSGRRRLSESSDRGRSRRITFPWRIDTERSSRVPVRQIGSVHDGGRIRITNCSTTSKPSALSGLAPLMLRAEESNSAKPL